MEAKEAPKKQQNNAWGLGDGLVNLDNLNKQPDQ